jgi:hypothetical protein
MINRDYWKAVAESELRLRAHRAAALAKSAAQLRERVTLVRLADLAGHRIESTEGDIQPESKYIRALVDAYEAAQRGEGEWPPPIFLRSRKRGPLLVDGNHRLLAARLAGIDRIPAHVSNNVDALRTAARLQERERAFHRPGEARRRLP